MRGPGDHRRPAGQHVREDLCGGHPREQREEREQQPQQYQEITVLQVHHRHPFEIGIRGMPGS
jgi:hypothetical protein